MFHPRKRCQVFVVHEREEKCQCSLRMLPGCWFGSVLDIMCICTFAAGGLNGDRGWERNEKLLYCTCTHGGPGIADIVCSVVAKNYIQVIVFYLLAQTKVIYLHIYINLLTKCLENIPRNTNTSNK